MGWRTANLLAYRAGHLGARWWRKRVALSVGPPRTDAPLLYLANGRLGDALLAAAFVRHYRAWFGPVVAVGRPETEAIVAPLVDAFAPWSPGAPAGVDAAHALLASGCRAVLGDLHLFHGGEALLDVATATKAPLLVYDGWIDRARQAPFRRWPKGARVVASRDKTGAVAGDAEALHVFGDLRAYHAEVLRHFSVSADLPSRPWLPPSALDVEALARLELPAGYIACHAASSQPKKDWPWAQFARVWAAFPDRTFALLGGAAVAAPPAPANVRDLRGRTGVGAALAVAAHARAFLGIDSGLAHAAANAGRPTVVVMPAATPGYFFPYPTAFGAHVRAVWSTEHRACAGCGGLCEFEPLWRSRRRGFPCLRAVPADAVVAALRQALAEAAAESAPHR